jgi:hypothetical protein
VGEIELVIHKVAAVVPMKLAIVKVLCAKNSIVNKVEVAVVAVELGKTVKVNVAIELLVNVVYMIANIVAVVEVVAAVGARMTVHDGDAIGGRIGKFPSASQMTSLSTSTASIVIVK